MPLQRKSSTKVKAWGGELVWRRYWKKRRRILILRTLASTEKVKAGRF